MVHTGRAVASSPPHVAISVGCPNMFLKLQFFMTLIRNLDSRKEKREQAWQLDGWAETVSKVRSIPLYPTANDISPIDGPIG
jgi:hypothetical protein